MEIKGRKLGTTVKVRIGSQSYSAQDIEKFRKKPESNRKVSGKVNDKIHSASQNTIADVSDQNRFRGLQIAPFEISKKVAVRPLSESFTEYAGRKYQHKDATLHPGAERNVENIANRLETQVHNTLSSVHQGEKKPVSSSPAVNAASPSLSKEVRNSQDDTVVKPIPSYASNVIRSDGIRLVQGKSLVVNHEIHSVKKPVAFYPSGKLSTNVMLKSRQVFADQEDSGSQTLSEGISLAMSGVTIYNGAKSLSPKIENSVKKIAHGTFQIGSYTIRTAKKADAFYTQVKYGNIQLDKDTFQKIRSKISFGISQSRAVSDIRYSAEKIRGIYHTGQKAVKTVTLYGHSIHHFAKGVTEGRTKINISKSVLEKMRANAKINSRYLADLSKGMALSGTKIASGAGKKAWNGIAKADRVIGGIGNSLLSSDDSGSQTLGIGLAGIHYANEAARYTPKIYKRTKKMIKTTASAPMKVGKDIALMRRKAIVVQQLIKHQGLKNTSYILKQKAQAGFSKVGKSIVQGGINIIQKLSSKMILPIVLILCIVLALNNILIAPVSGVSSLFSGTFTIRDTGEEYDIHEYLMTHMQGYQDAFINQVMNVQEEALAAGYDYVRLIKRGSGPINGVDRNITRGDVSSLIFTMAGGNYVIMDTNDDGESDSNDDGGNNSGNNNQNIDTSRVDAILNDAGKLAGTRQVIFDIAGRYNIDPLLMIAICLHETGYGTSSAIMNYNNPSGQMSSSGLIHFDTLEDGLEMTGRTLNNLINERGLQTIPDLGSVYCPVGADNDPYGLNGYWVPSVTRIYNELGGTGAISSGNAASMGNGVVSIIEPFFKVILLTEYELEPTQAQVDNLLQELWDNIFSIETGELPMEYCSGVHSCGERHADITSCPRITSGTHDSYTCPDCCYMTCDGHDELELQPDGSIKIKRTYCEGCIENCNGYYNCEGHYIYGITVNMDGTQRLLALYFMDPINRLANLTNPTLAEKEELSNLKDNYELCLVYLQESQSNMRYGSGGQTDLSGVQFVNGSRRGNQQVIDLALAQEGQEGGRPYWSWSGFGSRVPWCACFVSWVLGNCGIPEPRFTYCPTGIEYFQANGRYAPGGYTDLVAGDIIFFDWEGDGESDHTGLVIGTDGVNVYTIEGNSGDACRVKSYDLNNSVICGYGMMNY